MIFWMNVSSADFLRMNVWVNGCVSRIGHFATLVAAVTHLAYISWVTGCDNYTADDKFLVLVINHL